MYLMNNKQTLQNIQNNFTSNLGWPPTKDWICCWKQYKHECYLHWQQKSWANKWCSKIRKNKIWESQKWQSWRGRNWWRFSVSFYVRILKYGFCKKLLQYKWTSDQLNTFFQISADLEKKWGQKCSTGQRFIFTKVTSYKIHILAGRS